ncbi:carbamoyl-phosphate synthase large subunit CarB [Oscillatoria nigro-viridis PCC 7112]|uniref:Carbamoyl-phosphate synthase large subunit CarB n=1 Tax=Phormidium nigroviride PCC 7112 TaxID=179408 RepID=K9VH76_9CYAN|nr:carbamoyl-phosphate synthase large subunit CarB [Oscillatoria nigro-viridis PCC 7112]
MIEELHKGFHPKIDFIEIQTPQLPFDQLKNLERPC